MEEKHNIWYQNPSVPCQKKKLKDKRTTKKYVGSHKLARKEIGWVAAELVNSHKGNLSNFSREIKSPNS